MLIGMDLKGNEPQWREKYMVVEAPENAEKMTFELAFFKNEDGGIANYDLQVDNLSMKVIQGEEGEPDVPPVTFTTPQAPKKVRQRYTQREFAIEWTDEDPAVEGFEIEAVAMQGRTTLSTQTYTTKEKRYFFEGMTPGVTYRIRLRSKKGTAFSDYSAPLEVETRQLGDFSGGTIPFLYTIEEDGSCPQKLPLYFLELTNPLYRRAGSQARGTHPHLPQPRYACPKHHRPGVRGQDLGSRISSHCQVALPNE